MDKISNKFRYDYYNIQEINNISEVECLMNFLIEDTKVALFELSYMNESITNLNESDLFSNSRKRIINEMHIIRERILEQAYAAKVLTKVGKSVKANPLKISDKTKIQKIGKTFNIKYGRLKNEYAKELYTIRKSNVKPEQKAKLYEKARDTFNRDLKVLRGEHMNAIRVH